MLPMRTVLATLLLLATLPCQAFWHLWTMNELYSSADGTVQYLEMTALAGAQQFVQGHSLVSRSADGRVHELVFPADLPGDSTGARMLIATRAFADLGIVAPDYIVPAGFFHRGGGSIDFLGADLWVHAALPADGRAITREGLSAVPSPTNFAGRTGSVPVDGAPRDEVNGLWWAFPAGSESGWGLALTVQADVMFAAWFTYAPDGRGQWLVATDARRASDNTFSGTLYRTTGPSFDAVPFDPSRVATAAAGSATWSFTDDCNGSFSYTLDGVSRTRAITRPVFAGPAPPSCR